MLHKRHLLALGLGLTTALSWYWATSDKKKSVSIKKLSATTQAPEINVAMTDNKVILSTKPVNKLQTQKQPAPFPEEEEELVVMQRFEEISTEYEKSIRYPTYSKPLSINDWKRLNPLAFSDIKLPLNEEGHATISSEKFIYFRPESVDVSVKLSAKTTQTSNISVKLCPKQTQACGSEIALKSEQDNEFRGEIPASEIPENESDEYWLTLNLNTSTGQEEKKTTIKYIDSVATLTEIGTPLMAQPDWIIPITLDAKLSGIYRIRANLFGKNNQPITYLTTKHKANEGENQITLRVFLPLIKNSAGPYVLSTFVIERMSSAPGKPPQYGNSLVDTQTLSGPSIIDFELDLYTPTEEEKQRLDFLKSLSL